MELLGDILHYGILHLGNKRNKSQTVGLVQSISQNIHGVYYLGIIWGKMDNLDYIKCLVLERNDTGFTLINLHQNIREIILPDSLIF